MQAKSLKQYLQDHVTVEPLSDSDLRRHGFDHILLYRELYSQDADNLFRDHDYVIILYPGDDAYNGHWVCLFLDKDDVIHYFDPYGKPCDYWISKEDRDNPVLSDILDDFEVKVNKFKFQEFGHKINNCGRWCLLRLKLRKISDESFKVLFGKKKYVLERDDLISMLV